MVNEIQKVFLTNGRDWLAIIVEALVPVAIMLFTLHSEKKRHRESLRQQAEEHEIELSVQKESTRLAILPIFNLVGMTATDEVTTLSSGVTLDRHIFTLHLENVGSGVAMSPFIIGFFLLIAFSLTPIWSTLQDRCIRPCGENDGFETTISGRRFLFEK